MKPSHGLSDATLQEIRNVLATFRGVESAVLFGSRAKGTQKHGSDIDLAIAGTGLDWRTVGEIYDALDDRLLPYKFSLVVLDENTDPEVAAHIARVGIRIFRRDRPAA